MASFMDAASSWETGASAPAYRYHHNHFETALPISASTATALQPAGERIATAPLA
jgi:hypothetical protein